jgi:hypothetical protein
VGRENTLFESVDIVQQNGSIRPRSLELVIPTAFEVALIGVVHRPVLMFEDLF